MTKLVPLVAICTAAALAGGCGGGSPAGAGTAPPPAAPPGEVTPEMAKQQVEVAANRVVQILNGIEDETTARSATLTLGPATSALSTAGRQKLTVVGEPAIEEDLPPEAGRVLDAVERVAKAPYGKVIQSELDAVVAAVEEMIPRADRPKYERELQKRGLRAEG